MISYITKRLCPSILKMTCKRPFTRVNRLGVECVVPCGTCENCLRSKRNQLTHRLKLQIEDKSTISSFFATYTYGDKQVYDDVKHTWITDKEGFTLPTISKTDLHNKVFNYDTLGFYIPTRVNIHKSNEELKNGKLLGIVYPRDLQLTLKKLRQRFYEQIGEKYHIEIKFHALAHYGSTEGRTFAPHFHLLYFLTCEDKTTLGLLLGNPILKEHIEGKFQQLALNSWIYSERFFDRNKQIWVGKDIEPITNGNVACYVSRYVSRDTINKKRPIINLFPIRKLGSKNLGYQMLDDKTKLSAFYSAFLLSKHKKVPFVVPYQENGFTKYYSSYVRFRFLLKRFNITSSQFNTFCKMQNKCICKNAFYCDDAQKTSLSKYLDENMCYYTTADIVPHKYNSRYIKRLTRRDLDKQNLLNSTGKNVLYDCFGLQLIEKLDDDIFSRCAEMYEFCLNSSFYTYQNEINESNCISELHSIELDDLVCTLDNGNIFEHHSFSGEIKIVLEKNKRTCKEIVDNNEKLENYHAIKNKYI